MRTSTKSVGLALLLVLVAVSSYWAGEARLLEPASNNTPSSPFPTIAAPAEKPIKRPKLYLPVVKPQRGYVRIKRVVDGDTLVVVRGGKDVRVRLIGIDTPEVGRYEIVESSPGWLATIWVFELLSKDPRVKLVYDAERLDKYERTLAYAYLPDGKMLNKEILLKGYGTTLTIAPNTKHAAEFMKALNAAQTAKRGMWAK